MLKIVVLLDFSVPDNFYFRLKPELITSIGFAQSGFENMFIFA
jgi:hypothetical protein